MADQDGARVLSIFAHEAVKVPHMVDHPERARRRAPACATLMIIDREGAATKSVP
jgi:hypothetical protein